MEPTINFFLASLVLGIGFTIGQAVVNAVVSAFHR